MSNPLEHQLDYPWSAPPVAGTVTTLRPGVHWLRMPLPFALDHINLWLLDDEIDGRPGWTIIDCGVASDPTRAAWERLFDSVLDGRPVLRVIATHYHPDHFGLADWLTRGGARQRWRAPLWMTFGEYAYGRLLSEGGGASGERSAAHFERHGLSDPAALEQMRQRGAGYYARLVPAVPPEFHRVRAADQIVIGTPRARRVFRAVVGFGHAPEHLSLHCAASDLLISGDMVLPRISTNIAVHEVEPEGNPLPDYLGSLDHYLRLPAATLVLPSHGLPFTGLHLRVAQQHAHHRARLAEVLAACAEPRSAADMLPVLFRRQLDLHQTSFAMGEAIAHLHALWFDGSLVRTLEPDGVYRFAAAAQAQAASAR